MTNNEIKAFVKRELYAAIELCRGNGSNAEAEYVAYLAKRGPTMIDTNGNLHFDLRNGESTTLFCAHTDTVHRETAPKWNKFDEYEENGYQWVKGTDKALGADDGAGIAILLTLMQCNVPGYYVFFRGEECGGIGSDGLAKEMPDLLEEFQRAIAFDRRGYDDVITYQFHGRCASDEFAQALADELNGLDGDFMYSPCDTGVFTDTANLVDYIPECTNIGVGYFDEHSHKESQNVTHLQQLAIACVNVQWEALPTERKIAPYEEPDHVFRRFGHDIWDDEEEDAKDNTLNSEQIDAIFNKLQTSNTL